MPSIAELLKNPPKDEDKTHKDKMQMLALLLANKALTVASETGAFRTEEGELDYSKAIPVVSWVE